MENHPDCSPIDVQTPMAPQGAGWGEPMATGSGEIDAFVSNAIMSSTMPLQRRYSADHPVTLTFFNIPAEGMVRITLASDVLSEWGGGDTLDKMVGVSVESASQARVVDLRFFLLNTREILFQAYKACPEIRIRLYLRTGHRAFRGYTDLPPGTSVTIETEMDRASLLERSSFGLLLKE